MDIYVLYLLLIVVVLCFLDGQFIYLFDLAVRWLLLELRKLPVRIRLELDILAIKLNRGRYLKIAKELRKELNLDE